MKNTAGKKQKIKSAVKLPELTAFVCAVFFLIFSSSCSQKDYSQFTKAADLCLEDEHFQGAVLIGQGKKVIYQKGRGLKDKKNKASGENTIETVFEAGSITKQMTAAAIMQLEQKHELSTKDKLSKYFPDYQHGDEITLEMLLNMHSGLTDYINSGEEFFPKNIYRYIENNHYQNKPLESDIVLTYFYNAPLMAKPDSTYFYCNTNYYLLAKIIEKVSGESYRQYIQKHIFEPCKMASSNLEFQHTDAKGYDYRGYYYSIPDELAFGCGDLNTTAADLFKWNQNFHGGKVISRKSYRKMTDNEGYGYGIYCSTDSYFHSGNTNVFNSYLAYYPENKISIIVLENCSISEQNAAFIARKLYKTLKDITKKQ